MSKFFKRKRNKENHIKKDKRNRCGWCGSLLPNGYKQCVEVSGMFCDPHNQYLFEQEQQRNQD